MVILWCFSRGSSVSALNPEAGSVRMTADGPSSGRKGGLGHHVECCVVHPPAGLRL